MKAGGRHLFDVPDELLQRIPEIAPELEAGIQDWRRFARDEPTVSYGDSPGCDYVFGSLLVPIVDRLGSNLPSPDARSTLEKLFEYLEELLADPNVNAGAMVKVSFCESAVEQPGALKATLELGGPGVLEHLAVLGHAKAETAAEEAPAK